MQWYNEPPAWTVEGGTITVTAGKETDFWRKTHYGFIHENGHFYFQPVSGDFTAEVRVSGQYTALYDQAGLMVRLDETTWMKCGIEFFDEMQHASVVVTRDFSDWSMVRLPQNPPTIWLRVIRHGDALTVYYFVDGAAYFMQREAYFPPVETISVGIMCAAPTGNGFEARFENFTLSQD